MLRILIVVGLILLIPFFGNLFVEGWNWIVLDFIVMGALLFVTGLAIDFAIRRFPNPIQRILAIAAIIGALLLIWVELAVDAVSRSLQMFIS